MGLKWKCVNHKFSDHSDTDYLYVSPNLYGLSKKYYVTQKASRIYRNEKYWVRWGMGDNKVPLERCQLHKKNEWLKKLKNTERYGYSAWLHISEENEFFRKKGV